MNFVEDNLIDAKIFSFQSFNGFEKVIIVLNSFKLNADASMADLS